MTAPRHPYRLSWWMLAVFASLAIAVADGDLGRIQVSAATYNVDDRFEVSVPSFAFEPPTVDEDDYISITIGCRGEATHLPPPSLDDSTESFMPIPPSDGRTYVDLHHGGFWCVVDDSVETEPSPRVFGGLIGDDGTLGGRWACPCAPIQARCLDTELRALVDAHLRGYSDGQFRAMINKHPAELQAFARHLSGYDDRDLMLFAPAIRMAGSLRLAETAR